MKINVTQALREKCQELFALEMDAEEAEVISTVKSALVSGTLKMETVKELTADASPRSELQKALDERDARNQLAMNKTLAAAGLLDEVKAEDGSVTFVAKGTAVQGAGGDGKGGGTSTKTGDTVTKAFQGGANGTEQGGGDEPSYDVRVKSVVERFDNTQTSAIFDRSSDLHNKSFGAAPVNAHMEGCGLGSYDYNMPTERSKAISGAWLKHLVNRQCKAEGRQVPWQFAMNEQDKHLVEYAARECKFVGPIGYEGRGTKTLTDNGDPDTIAARHWFDGSTACKDMADGDLWIKALLDEAAGSQGLEAVPIEFDANYILTPLLTGQLFPLASVTNVTRRRIEATTFANPTVGWGVAEGTAITPFNTDGFVGAFDNNIWPVTGAMEIGRDFQSDSPLDIGGIVVDRYGVAFRNEMDNVIATGNGTDRPTGLFTTAGVTTELSAGGPGAAPTPGDYEGMMHGVDLAFMQEAGLPPRSRAVFLTTQVSYQRSRSIQIAAGDQRRFFGRDGQMSYSTYSFRHAINSTVTNAKLGFFLMNRYRLYRRQGLEVRIVRDDRTGALANTDMLVLRARFGGALDHSGAGVKIEDAQA